jgi:hypothetical protein
MELARKMRDISLEEAKESYQELVEIACDKTKPLSRSGIKALDYFFLGHRLRAKTKHHISFADGIKDRKLRAYLHEKIRKIKPNPDEIFADPVKLLRQEYSVFQLYYGTINQFRPTEAMKIYCKLGAKVGILDFSAGWGGRCIAAMALGIPYFGIDANKNLEPAYSAMIKAYNPSADVKLVFQPSETVDFSNFKYDLVFTSPPYFMLEEYERMPQYGSKQGFMDKFFKPVVLKAWGGLPNGGHLALNMPHEMYMEVRGILPPIHSRILLPISNRHPTNARVGRQLGTEKERHEYTYVWKKGAEARKTRKVAKKNI